MGHDGALGRIICIGKEVWFSHGRDRNYSTFIVLILENTFLMDTLVQRWKVREFAVRSVFEKFQIVSCFTNLADAVGL